MKRLLDVARKETSSSWSGVFSLDSSGDLVLEEAYPDLKTKPSVFMDLVKKTLEEKTPLDSTSCPLKNCILWPGSGSSPQVHFLCIPVFLNGSPMGAVLLEKNSWGEGYSETDVETVNELAGPIRTILKKRNFWQAGFGEQDLPSLPFIGESPVFHEVLSLIDCVKDHDIPVFIRGESGTGKDLVARMIHERGPRAQHRFVAVNCGAIPDTLVESELFGYKRGAFTGALFDKPGMIEDAQGGSFFLDEIADLSFPLQAKLLRLLQNKELRRLGENKTRPVDVRFLSATNKDIEAEIEKGLFREDLFYRISVVVIDIPPLRRRKDDIPGLLNYFLDINCRELGRERSFFSPGAVERLMDYSWPGNVRELQNEVKKCLVICRSGMIHERYLSRKINPDGVSVKEETYDYFQAKNEFEKRFIKQALARFDFNRTRTAKNLGLSRQGLFKLMRKHRITTP
ncbi:MAG: sigma-54-dependent Fis family transcriptional regulator [Candidatus Aminicenantes bacterium]|nr:sigma-54-dependent Fis family transcriptional regulator [Candidatus Aminicenantes bacterium]